MSGSLDRRTLIAGSAALIFAPAVVRTPGLLMPTRSFLRRCDTKLVHITVRLGVSGLEWAAAPIGPDVYEFEASWTLPQ